MKTIALLLFSSILTTLIIAQPCHPDTTYTLLNVGVYPESVINGGPGLPSGCINQFYDLTMTAVVPDSIEAIEGSGTFYPIDSIILNSNTSELMNLPTGISLECSPASCRYIGGGYFCNKISGTPTELGSWNVVYDVTVYLDFGGFVLAVDNIDSSYQIIIHDIDSTYCFTSVKDIIEEPILEFYPNPVSDRLFLVAKDYSMKDASLKIYDANGRIKYAKTLENIDLNGHTYSISLESLASGIYSLLIETEEGSYSERLIKI